MNGLPVACSQIAIALDGYFSVVTRAICILPLVDLA